MFTSRFKGVIFGKTEKGEETKSNNDKKLKYSKSSTSARHKKRADFMNFQPFLYALHNFLKKVLKIANQKTRENERKRELLRVFAFLNRFDTKKFSKRG